MNILIFFLFLTKITSQTSQTKTNQKFQFLLGLEILKNSTIDVQCIFGALVLCYVLSSLIMYTCIIVICYTTSCNSMIYIFNKTLKTKINYKKINYKKIGKVFIVSFCIVIILEIMITDRITKLFEMKSIFKGMVNETKNDFHSFLQAIEDKDNAKIEKIILNVDNRFKKIVVIQQIILLTNKVKMGVLDEAESNEAELNKVKEASEAEIKNLMEGCYTKKDVKEIHKLYKKISFIGHTDRINSNTSLTEELKNNIIKGQVQCASLYDTFKYLYL